MFCEMRRIGRTNMRLTATKRRSDRISEIAAHSQSTPTE